MDYASTHRDIVERCQRGNRQAQYELYRLYSTAMYNICLRMLKNTADAEDLLQRSFVDVFTKLDTFQFQSSVGAWIKRIVVNNCINYLKKRRLKVQELEDRHTGIAADEPVYAADDCGYNVQKINEAVRNLPEGYRVVFSLYMFEGYDHGEIADILGISEATSKSQYSRAKRKLREMLAEII